MDTASIAEKNGLGVRINTIMETVFLKLSAVVDFDRAVSALKEIVSRTYNHDGSVMVERNIDAIDQAFDAIQSIEIPPSWALATDEPVADTDSDMPDFVKTLPDHACAVRVMLCRSALSVRMDSRRWEPRHTRNVPSRLKCRNGTVRSAYSARCVPWCAHMQLFVLSFSLRKKRMPDLQV